ncbi:MAG: hypothetical protein ACRCZS_06560 [Chroococcidiopsis sp.]
MLCNEFGCTNIDAIACSYPDNETEVPNYYYCSNHAFKHGFCNGCGQFGTGIESFDFSTFYGGIEGFCLDCSDELKRATGEEDEDEEFEMIPDYL